MPMLCSLRDTHLYTGSSFRLVLVHRKISSVSLLVSLARFVERSGRSFWFLHDNLIGLLCRCLCAVHVLIEKHGYFVLAHEICN